VVLEYGGQRIREIFQEVPAIRNLQGMGRTITNRLRISLGSVTGDNLNSRMVTQPLTDAFGSSVRKQVNDVPTLMVNQDSAIALSLPDCPVVDAQNSWGRTFRERALPCKGEK
jgi:hypothetical protein